MTFSDLLHSPMAAREEALRRGADRRRRRRRVVLAIFAAALMIAPVTYVTSAEPLNGHLRGLSTDPVDAGDDPWRRSFVRHDLYAFPEVTTIRVVPGRELWEFLSFVNTSPFKVVVTDIEIPRIPGIETVDVFLPGGLGSQSDYSKLTPFEPTPLTAFGSHATPEAVRGPGLEVAIRYRFKGCPPSTSVDPDLLTKRLVSRGGSGWESHVLHFTLWGIPRAQRVPLGEGVELLDVGTSCV